MTARAGLRRWHVLMLKPGMNDFVFVAVTVSFFALSWLYAKSFDHL